MMVEPDHGTIDLGDKAIGALPVADFVDAIVAETSVPDGVDAGVPEEPTSSSHISGRIRRRVAQGWHRFVMVDLDDADVLPSVSSNADREFLTPRPNDISGLSVGGSAATERPATGLSTLSTGALLRLGARAAIIVLVCATIALGFAMTRTTIFGAQVDVVYEPAPSSASSVQLDRDLATQAVILHSRTVLAPVATSNRISLRWLEGASSVEVLPGTEILRVTVGTRDRPRARALAQDIAETYVGITHGRVPPVLLGSVVRRAHDLTGQLADVQRDTAAAEAAGDVDRVEQLNSQADDLTARITSTLRRMATVSGNPTRQGEPRLLAQAHLMASPLYPRPVQAAATGALIGTILAAAMAYLLTRRRTA